DHQLRHLWVCSTPRWIRVSLRSRLSRLSKTSLPSYIGDSLMAHLERGNVEIRVSDLDDAPARVGTKTKGQFIELRDQLTRWSNSRRCHIHTHVMQSGTSTLNVPKPLRPFDSHGSVQPSRIPYTPAKQHPIQPERLRALIVLPWQFITLKRNPSAVDIKEFELGRAGLGEADLTCVVLDKGEPN
ncbi:unnamed protein product, partial [Rhizoctonia solani]